MTTQSGLWQFIGGIGLFLFAMVQLETALRAFAGGTLHSFLQRHTDTGLKSVTVGAIATAFVQSSSLIGLMVLAFVGASVVSLENALGVIFGANLGTTFTGWVVTTLGFKLDLENAALPLVGIGLLVLVSSKGRLSEYGRLTGALGFLLMGLSFMKDSVAFVATSIAIDFLGGLQNYQYLLFGVMLAALVQSSSAVMMLTLTALHAAVIELPSAGAVAIGADLGTTSTVLIGAIGGAAGKKRVAAAHVIFNVTTAIIAFAFLLPLLDFVRIIGVQDPLLSLVTFHSLFNLIGILIFLPVMKQFARILGNRFGSKEPHENRYVGETLPTVTDAALQAITAETAHIIGRVIRQNLSVFSPPIPEPPGRLPVDAPVGEGLADLSFNELYRKNKKLEGEILRFAVLVQSEPLESAQSERLSRLLSAVRHVVHSAKSLRDIHHNLIDFGRAPQSQISAYRNHFRGVATEFYSQIFRLRAESGADVVMRDFADLAARNREWHAHLHHVIYGDIREGEIASETISSLLNVNREFLSSNEALIVALQEFWLSESEADVLDELPSST